MIRGLHRARQHFLGPTAGRDEAHTDLDEAHVGFRSCLRSVSVKHDLASAAERQCCRRGNHRNLSKSQRHRGALKCADHQVDLFPVALLRLEQQEHQVGAGGKIRCIVSDDERAETRCCLLDAGLEHLDGVPADRVHLRVELDAEDIVAEVDEARASVGADYLAAFAGGAKDLQVGCSRRYASAPRRG